MRSFVILIIVFSVIASCREKYEVNLAPTQTSFLVVEGSIVTNGITKINLSRTTLLEEKNVQYETGATVTVESENNAVYTLVDKDSGRYELPFTSLDDNAKYRVNIKTKDNREYVSGYVQAIKTPEIDAITWTRYNDGIEIYVNTKDPENNTPYYRFEYEEAWEFRSPVKQYLIATVHNNPPAPVSVSVSRYDPTSFSYIDSIAICWQFRNSSKILLGSTTKLSENKVYLPLVNYPKDVIEFSQLYSINVKQYGISKEEYEFFQKMKKNTESLGTIFDAQPSELTGNFTCLTDTSEIIVGFVGATSVKQKRKFISVTELPDWNYSEGCSPIAIMSNQDDLLQYFYRWQGDYLPSQEIEKDGAVAGYWISTPKCMDCRLRGSNKKPAFWP